MPTLVGFGTFAALPEEQISEKISRRILSSDQGMIVWWSIALRLLTRDGGPVIVGVAQPQRAALHQHAGHPHMREERV